jgi:hypothetical protein
MRLERNTEMWLGAIRICSPNIFTIVVGVHLHSLDSIQRDHWEAPNNGRVQ